MLKLFIRPKHPPPPFQPVPTDIDVFDWLASLLTVLKPSVSADLNETLRAADFSDFSSLNEDSWIFLSSTGKNILLKTEETNDVKTEKHTL